MSDEELSVEAFAGIAKRAGVRIDQDDLAIMRDGYIGLQAMLARLPKAPDFFDEPAVVFVPPGSAVL